MPQLNDKVWVTKTRSPASRRFASFKLYRLFFCVEQDQYAWTFRAELHPSLFIIYEAWTKDDRPYRIVEGDA